MSKEAMKLALEALQNAWLDASMGKGDVYRHNEAIKALEEALASEQEQCKYPNCDYPCMNLPDCHEQEQGEPVAQCCSAGIAHDCHAGDGCRIVERIKSTPQPAQKPLTDEQIEQMWERTGDYDSFARAIEYTHGIKE
jgi:hypothetical protein